MDEGSQPVEQRRVRDISDRLAGWVDADRELQADGCQEARRLLDRDTADEAALHPTVVGTADPDGTADGLAAEISVEPGVV
jgi:hypothetical protein